MAQASTIEWTEATWNPVTGCTKVSPGCKFCYAERMAHRLQAMGQVRYRNAFKLTLQPEAIEAPLRWRKPRVIFVNSMSDLFHVDVPLEYIQRCFAVMEEASQHTFQILTKRPERVAAICNELPWPANVWMGTSVENVDYVWRVEALRQVPSKTRFLSVEPLLGSIPRLPLDDIHWVIVGGESGPGARPMKVEWVREIRDQCASVDVPFFFQAVGWRQQEEGWTNPGWKNMGRNAKRGSKWLIRSQRFGPQTHIHS
jgi:protein gp37